MNCDFINTKFQWKFQKGGLEIFQKIHEIYETFKLENFIPHHYMHKTTLLLYFGRCLPVDRQWTLPVTAVAHGVSSRSWCQLGFYYFLFNCFLTWSDVYVCNTFYLKVGVVRVLTEVQGISIIVLFLGKWILGILSVSIVSGDSAVRMIQHIRGPIGLMKIVNEKMTIR